MDVPLGESVRCNIRCRQMSKARSGGGEPRDLGLPQVCLVGHTTVLVAASAASVMAAPPTGMNVSSFHPNWEANISVVLFVRVYQIHPVSKSSWQQLSHKPEIIQSHQFRDQTRKALNLISSYSDGKIQDFK